MPAYLKSALISVCVALPSAIASFYLMGAQLPSQYVYVIAWAIIAMVVLDFATVIFIEQFRRHLGHLTLPALLAAIGVAFLFMLSETLNRFIEGLGYTFLDPLIVIGMLLIYAAIFMEKSMVLKSYLSINGVVLALLWTMGASDKITMPF